MAELRGSVQTESLLIRKLPLKVDASLSFDFLMPLQFLVAFRASSAALCPRSGCIPSKTRAVPRPLK